MLRRLTPALMSACLALGVVLAPATLGVADPGSDSDQWSTSKAYASRENDSVTVEARTGGAVSSPSSGARASSGTNASGSSRPVSSGTSQATTDTPATFDALSEPYRVGGLRPSCAGANYLPCILEPEPEPADPAAPAPAGPVGPSAATVARRAVAHLQIPEVDPQAGPQPVVSDGQPIIPVGMPVWLWTPATPQTATTVTQDGITVSLDASALRTDFDMGNGQVVSCTTTTPYQARPHGSNLPDTSPTCGYTYQHMNPIANTGYTLTATTVWQVRWSALNQTGILHIARTGTRHLPVGEIWALTIPHP